ncbi:MAG: hypothetical protein AAB472_02075 [Patescibacteria group bacterium]
MEPDLSQKLQDLTLKVEAVYASVEKTRKYFQWTLIITVVLFLLPLIGLLFVIPAFISSYSASLQGLGV